ncbi:MFS transporter [Oleiharenicola lentus]|nr:MFS transporter [Oleiharenicola lentus]
MRDSDAPHAPTTSEVPRAGAGRILIFALIFFGLGVTEEVSNNVLPLTLQRMTADFSWSVDLPFRLPGLAPDGVFTMGSALVIGLVLALNPLFGFIAQPLVGVLSDRVWTRVGRRAFFLITGAPVVAVCLFLVPWASALWQLVVLVVIYQFFQDVLWGSDHPLLADLFPSRQRGIVGAAIGVAYQLGAVFVTRAGLAWTAAHERTHGGDLFGAPIYWAAAAIQVGLVMGLAFFLWERRLPVMKRPRLTPGQYVRDFRAQPGLVRLGWVNFLRAFMVTAGTGYLVLFGTVTLAADKADYARAMGWLPLLALVFVWPAGLLTDRLARDRVLMAAFLLSAVGYAVGWMADSLAWLSVAFVITRLAWVNIEIGYKSLVSDFYPVHQVGQLAGAINIFYASGRTLALVSVGALIGAFGNDYRLAWPVAIAAALVSIWVLRGVRDPRSPSP